MNGSLWAKIRRKNRRSGRGESLYPYTSTPFPYGPHILAVERGLKQKSSPDKKAVEEEEEEYD